jgi:uncharacterized protein
VSEMTALVCPKCRAAMRTYERSGIVIDQCEECRGIFLDRGELERLMQMELGPTGGYRAGRDADGLGRGDDDDRAFDHGHGGHDRDRDDWRRPGGKDRPAGDLRRREGRFGSLLDIFGGD